MDTFVGHSPGADGQPGQVDVKVASFGETIGQARERMLAQYAEMPWWLRLWHWRTASKLRRMRIPTLDEILRTRRIIGRQVRP